MGYNVLSFDGRSGCWSWVLKADILSQRKGTLNIGQFRSQQINNQEYNQYLVRYQYRLFFNIILIFQKHNNKQPINKLQNNQRQQYFIPQILTVSVPQLIKSKMGACFQPGVNKVVIYASLIQQIYQQGKSIPLHTLKQTNTNPYDTIYQKISKKGLYRKLSDHLTAHRNNVNECMMNIFTHVRQDKDRNSCFVHLTLIDEMAKNFESFVDEGPLNRKKHHKEPSSELKEEYVNKEIESKFETLYFQMMIEIYDDDLDVRDVLLRNVMKFAKKERAFLNSRLAWELIDKLLDSIQQNELLELSIETYSYLLEKASTESILSHERSKEALRTFIELWMLSGNACVSLYCQSIFKIYIENCLTSRDYGFIYDAIFDVEDKYMFDERYFSALEAKIFQMVSEEDFKDQFCKGIFKYLISYLCVCDNEKIKKIKDRWEFGLFDTPYQVFRLKYPNILQREVKINGFKTLMRWIQAEIVKPNDFVTYNRTTLICCLILNVYSYLQDTVILQMSVDLFFQIYKNCDHTCKSIICSQLFQEIHLADQQTTKETSILVRMTKKILQDLSIQKLDSTQYTLFSPIANNLPIKTKIELIQLSNILFDCFSNPYNMTLIEYICVFLHSCERIIQVGTAKQKYEITCSLISLFKKLNEKKQIELIYCYLKRAYKMRGEFECLDQLYFQNYIVFELTEILVRKTIVPIDMRRLNLKIYCTQNCNIEKDISDYINKNREKLNHPILDSILVNSSDSSRIEFVDNEFSKLDQVTKDEESEINFKVTGGYFNPPRKTSEISGRDWSYKNDESFNDIFEMINQDKYL